VVFDFASDSVRAHLHVRAFSRASVHQMKNSGYQAPACEGLRSAPCSVSRRQGWHTGPISAAPLRAREVLLSRSRRAKVARMTDRGLNSSMNGKRSRARGAPRVSRTGRRSRQSPSSGRRCGTRSVCTVRWARTAVNQCLKSCLFSTNSKTATSSIVKRCGTTWIQAGRTHEQPQLERQALQAIDSFLASLARGGSWFCSLGGGHACKSGRGKTLRRRALPRGGVRARWQKKKRKTCLASTTLACVPHKGALSGD
jgi:hypothetical protein